MIVPINQALLAILLFALPAIFFTRLRLVKGEKGAPRYYSSYGQMSAARMNAASAYLNGFLLKTGWAWVLLCAPLLTYLDGGFDFKRYGVILLGCILFGIILGSVTYRKIEGFPNVDPGDFEGMVHAHAQLFFRQAVERAHNAARSSNLTTLILSVVLACLSPLWQYPAIWASGFTTLWYVVFMVGFALLLLIVHSMVNLRV